MDTKSPVIIPQVVRGIQKQLTILVKLLTDNKETFYLDICTFSCKYSENISWMHEKSFLCLVNGGVQFLLLSVLWMVLLTVFMELSSVPFVFILFV